MPVFLDLIKRDISDPRKIRGSQESVSVNYRALRELIHHFEELDAYERAVHPSARAEHLNTQLHDTITAVYEGQGKNAETTLMVIMDTLRPLMEKRYKDKQLEHYLMR